MSDRLTKKDYRRCCRWYKFAKTVPGPIFLKLEHWQGEKVKMDKEPFLMFSNHAMNFDPGFQICMFNRYMRFVASDHLVEKAPVRKAMDITSRSIIKRHEAPTSVVYNEIVQTIKDGYNVTVSVESKKSNNGETGFISRRNAELAKDCGCKLVTYRLYGGYFHTPRWANEMRWGTTSGEVVNIYSKEEVAAMSVDELYAHILEDLYLNAYEWNRDKMYKYPCKHPAESAEIILYACPKCHEYGTLHSKDDHIDCKCGFHATVDDCGYWHSKDMPFDDLVSWDHWQRDMLKDLCEEKKGTKDFFFEDDKQLVYISKGTEKTVLSEDAHITLYADRFEIDLSKNNNVVIYLDDIKKIDNNSKMTLLIVTDDNYYHIKSPSYPRSATKYVVAGRYLMGKDYK